MFLSDEVQRLAVFLRVARIFSGKNQILESDFMKKYFLKYRFGIGATDFSLPQTKHFYFKSVSLQS
jgi:hypothetical protein